MARVCADHGVTLPQAALAYVRRHPAVVSTVVGLGSARHVREAVQRHTSDVPDDLWTALVGAGLLAEKAHPSTTR
jgi:D-threo-aldose 1-dehydrogenase